MKINSANVLITGGASGIGKIMGRMALEKGAKELIIWDVNQEALDSTAAELSPRGRVHIYKVDITNITSCFHIFSVITFLSIIFDTFECAANLVNKTLEHLTAGLLVELVPSCHDV